MSSDPTLLRRAELRKHAIALRDGIPAEMRDAYSQLIRKRTLELLRSISARHVHCYLSFRSEVSTTGIIEDLFEEGVKLSVPFIIGSKDDVVMHHSLLTDLKDLRQGNFGVPEPVKTQESDLGDLDAVLIPVVAFDGAGARLGYGKGFYDRFLSRVPPKVRRIGLAFSLQEMDIIPILSHDQLINNIITEQSVFFFK